MRFCVKESDLLPVAAALLTAHRGSKIFAFYGPMGAGKTTFIKTLGTILKVTDTVQSPTFSLINEYKTRSDEPVFHFDFYRIRKIEEVFDMGYEEYLYSGAYCFIEWPELIEQLLPDGTVKITITPDPVTGMRVFEF